MVGAIITIISGVIAIIVAIVNRNSRVNAEKRRLADEAKEKLDKAHESGNKSDLLDAWGNVKRM